MSLEAGTRVGRYTITRLVAQGGMAEVYRAEQDLAGGITRPVAVKVIRPEFAESQDFREMFLDEARTACTLSHPNIAHIYEVGEEDGQLFMVMELVTGETLATINRTLRTHDERFSDEALFAIGMSTAAALEAVHALKVESGTVNLVHRDVSPHNLLLSSTGALKLIDFGIAKAATNRNLTMPGVTKGKAGYFSPEQAMGKRLDGRSDLFSLGVTLYKLTCGSTPFDDHTTHAERHAALVRGQFKHLDEVYRGLPEGFYAVLRRTLAVNPDDRFQSARELREALERAAFDARLRVGQSSLVGYIDERGDITVGGGGRASAAELSEILSSGNPLPPETSRGAATLDPQQTLDPVVTAPDLMGPPSEGATPLSAPALPEPRRPAPTTQRLRAVKPLQALRRPLLALAFVASIIIGIFGVMLVAGPGPDPLAGTGTFAVPAVHPRPAEPSAITAPSVDTGHKDLADKAPSDRAPDPSPAAAPRPPAPVVERPRPRPPRPAEKTPRAEKVDNTPAAATGEGTLRMGVSGGGEGAIFFVDGLSLGGSPVQSRVRAGPHRVTVKIPDGPAKETTVNVPSDKTIRLTFDAASLRWAAE